MYSRVFGHGVQVIFHIRMHKWRTCKSLWDPVHSTISIQIICWVQMVLPSGTYASHPLGSNACYLTGLREADGSQGERGAYTVGILRRSHCIFVLMGL